MTECTQEVFRFAEHFSRRVEAGFTAGQVSSDGGALLLRQTERKINLLPRLAACFTDQRTQSQVTHSLSEMLSQRIYGLALGYEDLNDHDQLRSDPLMAVLAGRRDLTEPLAGKSTLHRLELTGHDSRYHKIRYSTEKLDHLLSAQVVQDRCSGQNQRTTGADGNEFCLSVEEHLCTSFRCFALLRPHNITFSQERPGRRCGALS